MKDLELLHAFGGKRHYWNRDKWLVVLLYNKEATYKNGYTTTKLSALFPKI